ncbi:hypothetical protein CYMTET_32030, partial [Cymbomonas tetramitiformis]
MVNHIGLKSTRLRAQCARRSPITDEINAPTTAAARPPNYEINTPTPPVTKINYEINIATYRSRSPTELRSTRRHSRTKPAINYEISHAYPAAVTTNYEINTPTLAK